MGKGFSPLKKKHSYNPYILLAIHMHQVSMPRSLLHALLLSPADTKHRHCPSQECRETENGRIGSIPMRVAANTEKSLELGGSVLNTFDAV
jgi:hypothetical protein